MPITFDPVEPSDPSDSLKQGAKLRMLLVGVNEYQDSSLMPLNFAVQDCKKLSEAFHTATDQFPQRRIVTHTDVDAEMPFSIDDLNTSLDRVLEGLTSEDTFLFYFSGHGALDKLSQQLYLCLPQTQLQDLPKTGLGIEDLLKRTNASGVGKQVVILDACHSGSVSFPKGRRPMGRQATEDSIPVSDPTFTPKLEEALKSYKPGSGKRFFALFSCKAEQQSWELPELEHGAFTFYLIQGLRGEAVDGGGCIDSYHLYKYVTRQTNEYVSKRWGRRQDPDQISSGDPNIVLGLGQKSIAPLHPDPKPGEQGISRLENQFRISVWQLLKEQKDLQDAATRKQVFQSAEKCYLSRETADRLEADTIQSFNDVLKRYEERTTRRLYECGLRDTLPFDDLRAELLQTIDLNPANLQASETAAIAHFQQHKDDYLAAFSREIHHQPDLRPETHQELRSPLVNLGFGDGVIDSFEAEAWQALKQHQQTYRADYRAAIYQSESPDAEALNRLQQQLGFGDRLVELIEAEEDTLCNQQKQAYRQAFAQAIHTSLAAAPVQDRQGLGAEIIDRIEAEETEQCDQQKQDYRQRYAHLVRQHTLRNQDYNELEQVRQQCGFSHSIVEALEAQENIDFEQGKQAYRDAYCTALHQEQPLSDVGLDLLRQLQAKLNLGPEIVTSLESDAAETFEQNRQRYFREYVSTIRQREKLAPNDRHRLGQTQQRLGLSNRVVDLIWQSADAAVEADKKNYRAAVDEAIRYPEDAIAQVRMAEVRQDCELGEELLQGLEHEVRRGVERDRNNYGDGLITELHAAFPLSLEAQHRLRQYQSDLRLGDAIVAEVTAVVIPGFERRQAEEKKQGDEEKRQQEEERQREESKRLEEKAQEKERQREESKRLEEKAQEKERQREEAKREESRRLLEPPPVPAPPRKFPLRAAIVALGVVGAIGLGTWAYLRHQEAQTNQAAQQERDRIAELKTKQDFQGCVDAANKFPAKSQFQTDVQGLLNQCKSDLQDQGLLNQVEAFEKSGKWKDAFATAFKVQQSSGVYSKAVERINALSKNFLSQIDQKYKQATEKTSFDQLIEELDAMIQSLPKNNQVTDKISDKKTVLTREWNQNQVILTEVENLKKQEEFDRARTKLGEIKLFGQEAQKSSDNWKKKVTGVLDEIQKAQKAAEARKSQPSPPIDPGGEGGGGGDGGDGGGRSGGDGGGRSGGDGGGRSGGDGGGKKPIILPPP